MVFDSDWNQMKKSRMISRKTTKWKKKTTKKNEKCSKIQILNFFFLFRKFNSMILFPIWSLISITKEKQREEEEEEKKSIGSSISQRVELPSSNPLRFVPFHSKNRWRNTFQVCTFSVVPWCLWGFPCGTSAWSSLIPLQAQVVLPLLSSSCATAARLLRLQPQSHPERKSASFDCRGWRERKEGEWERKI